MTSRPRLRRQLVSGIGVAALAGLLLAVACAPAPAPTPADGAARPAAGAAPAAGAPAQTRVRIAYADLAPAQSPVWIGYESGIFARHGLDVELSYIASAQTVPAVVSGEVDVAFGGAYAAMSSRLAGSDLLIFYALVNWYPYELMARPGIETAADLRGERVAVSRFGSSSDVATRLALQHLGLDPERDVTFVQMGSLTERTAAMRTGAIAAGLVGQPEPRRLRQMGFKSLLDLAALGDEAMINTGFASASWMRANEPTVQALVDGLIESVHFAKTNREFTERVIAQYTKWDDPDEVAEAYDHDIARNLPRVGHPSLEEGRKYLVSQVPTDPRAAGADPAEFFDLRFTERAVASGLVERLYGRQ